MSKGWTIQRLIDARMTVTAYCHRPTCRHNQSLDLEAAIKQKLGPDAPAMADDLLPKLKCKRCGGKEVGLIYAPDPHQNTGMGIANRYQKSKGQ